MHPQSQKARLSLSALIERGISVALAVCLLSPQCPATAADDDEAALSKAEMILFGEPSRQGDLEERLKRAEKRVFGRRKSGSPEERVERLTSTLLIDRKQLPVTKKPEAVDIKTTESARAEEPAKEAGATSQSETAQPDITAKSEPSAQGKPADAIAPAPEISPVKVESEKPALPEARVSVPKPVNEKVVLKGKGKKVARGARAGQPPGKGMAAAAKRPEIILTPQTALMDVAKPEKTHPSALDTPVLSGSPHRISRGASAPVSPAAALLKEGMEAHRQGEDARAEQLFKRVVLLEPRNPDGYFNLGAIAEKKHDLAAALMSYRAALNLSPNDRELREAVDSVERLLGVEASNEKVARTGRAPAGNRGESPENSDRFAASGGSYGFGSAGESGPAPAPNFYRAKAKTTRELQEQAAPLADVNDPDAPELTVSQPNPPVVNASQTTPFQLQTAQNQSMAQASHRGHPVASVATRAILGAALSVGTSYALRSSGLHCPICRIGSGRALRGLLRF